MEQKKSITGIVVLIIFSVLIMAAVFKALFRSSSYELGSGSGKNIAVVEVEGIIMDSDKIIKKLRKAEKDGYKAIILRINSPGGSVAPCQEIYEEITRIDANIPVYSSLASLAASGGYYIAAATRRIYASPGTLTGSIGVIMNFFDLSKLYDLVRVSPEVLTAGKYKDAGSSFRKMTQEERSMYKELLTSVHKQFITDIVKKREKNLTVDINEVSQGQLFSGEMAMKHGLVDRMASLYTAGLEIHNDLGIKGEFKLRFIREKREVSLIEIFDSVKGLFMGKYSTGDNTQMMFL